jgi:hypothetical protein
VRPEGLGKFKISPHRASNARPSGLQPSALSTTLPRGEERGSGVHFVRVLRFSALILVPPEYGTGGRTAAAVPSGMSRHTSRFFLCF